MGSLLRVENLTISFGGLKAVNNVSFDVTKNEIFSIIGPNGAGKSTIYNCISGIYAPEKGGVYFENKLITGLKPHLIAGMGIARTFQNIELFARMTAMDNILLGRHIHMKYGLFSGAFMFGSRSRAAAEEEEHRAAAEKIINFLELESARDHFVGSLPYGRQKLIELARALALEPKLLLLDEPSAGMNSEEKNDLIYSIRDIRDEMGVTVLIIEHDMQMVMDISDRVMAINFGELITIDEPRKVASHPGVLKAYLGEEDVPA